MRKRLAAALFALALAGLAPARAQDVLSLAALEAAPGQVRALPVAVRDLSGTLLDEGDGGDLEIQGFAFRVEFAPAEPVTAVTFVQAGVTAGRTPIFPVVSPFADHIVVLMSFDAATDPLAFALDAAAPGDVVGELRVTLSPAALPGTLLTLALDAASATLVNGAATLSETVGNGHLTLVDGAILVDAAIFADGFESGGFGGWTSHLP